MSQKSKYTKSSALRRGFAQALDLTGSIGDKRLRAIKSRTVGDAFVRDWSMLGGDFRHVTSCWIRKRDE